MDTTAQSTMSKPTLSKSTTSKSATAPANSRPVLRPVLRQWVLIRGLAREVRYWGRFPQLLQDRFPDSAVHCVEIPGNGQLHQQASPASVWQMMEQMREQLAEVPRPLTLVAMSLGGMIATAWATAYPDELDHLVLINTSLGAFSPFYQRLRPRCYGKVLHSLVAPPTQREGLIFDITSNLRQQDKTAVVQQWRHYSRQYPVSKRNGLRQLWAAASFRGPNQAPTVPTTLLASQGDRMVHWRCSAAIAAAWQAPLKLHSRAGHDLPMDDAPWVLAQLSDIVAPPQAAAEELCTAAADAERRDRVSY